MDNLTSEESINETENKNQIKKHKNLNIYLLILLIFIGLIIIVAISYAKYVTVTNASANAQVADFKCVMEVIPNEDPNSNIVNPYCTIKVKNHDDKGNIAQTDVDFKIEVTTKQGNTELPEYHWYKDDQEIGKKSEPLTGTLQSVQQDSQQAKQVDETYKIEFINEGNEDITREIEFKLTATQSKPSSTTD